MADMAILGKAQYLNPTSLQISRNHWTRGAFKGDDGSTDTTKKRPAISAGQIEPALVKS